MTTTTFPNGQVLTSTALSKDQMNLIWQTAALQILGIPAFLDIASTTADSDQITVENGALYAIGQEVWAPFNPGLIPLDLSGAVPAAAVITAIANNVLTLSVEASAAASGVMVSICAPNASNRVRLTWPTDGQPDWAVTDSVAFVSAVLEDDEYDKIRDPFIYANQAAPSTLLNATQTYTRCWRIEYEPWGPNSLDESRLFKTGLFLDFVNDFLTGFKLAPVTEYPSPHRVPEKFQGQWYESAPFTFRLYELVTEVLTVASVESVEVKLNTAAGQVADFTV